MDYRIEHDALGEVKVPADHDWGAQTQRALENFRIGQEKMPPRLLRAMFIVKEAAAKTNAQLGVLEQQYADAIINVCQELMDDGLEDFPLSIWQSGSGTQTNMNVNEVIARRASQQSGLKIHPNDHVNMSQSTNDVFPTAMHIAACLAVRDELQPALRGAYSVLEAKAKAFEDVVKIGRTHLQDATPLTLGQEISAWAEMLLQDEHRIQNMMLPCRSLALGGTAVGTGLNSPLYYDQDACDAIAARTSYPFTVSVNKFHSLTSRAPLLGLHSGLNALAADLMKIANDIRWLASGPRSGLGELNIPSNEPGSSIMPGKVNPTQCESLTMVCAHVMGHETTMTIAASQGHFQLNVFAPLMIHVTLNSIELLSDALKSFTKLTLAGLAPNREKIQEHLDNSLMLVTALSPHIGYEQAAAAALKAHEEGITLREAALAMEIVTEEEYDRWVKPEDMLGPYGSGAE